MRKLFFFIVCLVYCISLKAQTTRFVNVGRTVNIPQQNWTLSTVYAKPFYTVFTWIVECKDISSSVYMPDNVYIEDTETHVRYGLAKKTIAINPSSFNQSLKYEITFKGIPSSTKCLKLVSQYFTMDKIYLDNRKKKEGDTSDSYKNISIVSNNINSSEADIVSVNSDVDINIPILKSRNGKVFVVIIANENYNEVTNVPFSIKDGGIFQEYCLKTLGIPQSNIHFTADATLNKLKRELNWLSQVMEVYNGEANIIFYYAGHGIPNESNGSAYLLPVDGVGNDVTTGYSLDKLYADLGSKPAKSVIVLLDACFSGARRDGGMLASARGVAIKAKQNAPKGNMVVLSAAQGDETAYPYKDKGHGLFTYYLLKKLQESKGDVTLGELADYVTAEVKKQSVVVNGKMQTPLASPSNNATDWRNWKLR